MSQACKRKAHTFAGAHEDPTSQHSPLTAHARALLVYMQPDMTSTKQPILCSRVSSPAQVQPGRERPGMIKANLAHCLLTVPK